MSFPSPHTAANAVLQRDREEIQQQTGRAWVDWMEIRLARSFTEFTRSSTE